MMNAPDLNAAAAFLDVHQFSNHETFCAAFRARITQTCGLFNDKTSDQSGTWASASAEVNLFGIFAHGETGDQAIRNWRRVASRLIDPTAPLTHTQTMLLSWSIEALTDPGMLADDAICARACRTILKLSKDQADRARAQAVLTALPEHAAHAA